MNNKAYLLQQLTRPLLESALLVNKMQRGELPLLVGLHLTAEQLDVIDQTVKTLQVMTKTERL